MFVDASVMVAILTKEPGYTDFVAKLDSTKSEKLITSVIAVWETTVALLKKTGISMTDSQARVSKFLALTKIQTLPVTNDDLPRALEAFDQYGRHRYPINDRNSSLNLADCFHYATAKSHRAPILTKDAGFTLTDLETIGVAKNQ
ncbi:type II toxin-antitoxin system VapC family toxin [Phyllobacterium sp. SB3]|uniref:type II toxin-antitoxin system VapC family toxin n=1 Tax=Phyllobacterium sp. SB3 TaxID=3156073 RepID=UPI0032AF0DB8